MFLYKPAVTPRRQPRGLPEPIFMSPRAKRGGPPALACLRMTRWEAATPRVLPPGDAVPSEARDARLTLGRTR
jgi:hypothetical protein